jgi:hypothetical protein
MDVSYARSGPTEHMQRGNAVPGITPGHCQPSWQPGYLGNRKTRARREEHPTTAYGAILRERIF